MPVYQPPPDHVWDRFFRAFLAGAVAYRDRQPSPVDGWTPQQYAAAKTSEALDVLAQSLGGTGKEGEGGEVARAVMLRISMAWHHLRMGLADPLFTPPKVKGRSPPEVWTLWFRSNVVRMCGVLAGGDMGSGWTEAAGEVSRALRAARAPKGFIPSVRSIEDWRRQIRTPTTPSEAHLSRYFRWIDGLPQRPEPDGPLDVQISWLLTGLSLLRETGR